MNSNNKLKEEIMPTTELTCGMPSGLDLEVFDEVFDVKKKRFMVYGSKCDNKQMYESEKELKKGMKELGNSEAWTGEIVGYKMIPIYVVKKKVKVETL